MADEIAIREALAANLAAVGDVQLSPWLLTNPTPPSVMIFAGEVEFDAAFGRGQDILVLIVQVLVGGPADTIGAQQNLAAYRAGSGTSSVKAAAESDRTLGGACQDLRVTGIGPERLFTFDGRGPFWGSEWRVEIRTHG